MKYLIFLVFCVFINYTLGFSYSGYKVFQVTPSSYIQTKELMSWESKPGIDFWREPRSLGDSADVMVNPENLYQFQTFLDQQNLKWKIAVDDVEKIVQNERKIRSKVKKSLPPDEYDFNDFYQHAQINSYLDSLSKNYPDYVLVRDEGKSYEGRVIKSILISNNKHARNNTLMILDGGIHAREWISPAFCMYITQMLVEYRTEHLDMLKNTDWLIVPLVNPDGYEYTHTTERFWRKTRRLNQGTKCIGVDGNRNYDHHWGEGPNLDDPCSEIYAGPSPASESEVKIISRIMELEARKNKTVYLSFHSYGYWILYPWSYTEEPAPRKHQLQRIGELAATAIHRNGGGIYKVGNTVDLLYAAPGGSHDYALGEAGIDISMTFELPPRSYGMEGFDPLPQDIRRICGETMHGVKAIGLYLGYNLS
uniref:Zinc carboxypeptidase A 1 n=1 Tax=Xenopsylla cheopis TaxID=163159 RepID=A0A6M2E0H8_XENCH